MMKLQIPAPNQSCRAGWSTCTAFEATQHILMLLSKHPPSLQVAVREVLTKILEILRSSSREIMEMALGKAPKDYRAILIPEATSRLSLLRSLVRWIHLSSESGVLFD
jgi:hypothetical protein